MTNWEETWKKNRAKFGSDSPVEKAEVAVTGLQGSYKTWIIVTGLIALTADLFAIHDSVTRR